MQYDIAEDSAQAFSTCRWQLQGPYSRSPTWLFVCSQRRAGWNQEGDWIIENRQHSLPQTGASALYQVCWAAPAPPPPCLLPTYAETREPVSRH